MLLAQQRCVLRSAKPLEIDPPTFECAHELNVTRRATIDGVGAGPDSWVCGTCILAQAPVHRTRNISLPPSAEAITYRDKLVKENGWQWFSVERMMRDVRALAPKVPLDCDAIAGAPRSGSMAAAYLSTLLNLPLYEASREGLRPCVVRLGSRGSKALLQNDEPQRAFVIEDSVYDGTSLQKLRTALGPQHVYAALYYRANARWQPDVFGLEAEAPHFFEWHFFNSGYMDGRVTHPALKGGSVLDMDGIVCEEPQAPDEPEAGYVKWLETAKPLWLPRQNSCRAILTARYEKHRAVTEDWLKRHRVKYDLLIMAEERSNVAAWKASVLRELRASIYVESSPMMATRIHKLWSDGAVLCPPAERALRPFSIPANGP